MISSTPTATNASALTDTIRGRGHFKTVIRPARFVAERFAHADLLPVLRRCAVRLRGWDVPQIDDLAPVMRGEDFVAQGTEWQHHLEYWRFHQSGLLVHLHAMTEDWQERRTLLGPPPAPVDLDQPRLGIVGAVHAYTAAFELAARLAAADVDGADPVHVEVEAAGLRGRRLYSEDKRRSDFHRPYMADVERVTAARRYPRAALLANPLGLSLRPARQLFQRFGWDAPEDVLRDVQQGLLRPDGAL